MKKLVYFLLCVIVNTSNVFSQSFTHLTKISGITKDSLYKIPLGPEVKQFMTKDLHDLRIMDSSDREVP